MCAARLYFSQHAGTNESSLPETQPCAWQAEASRQSINRNRALNLLIKNHIAFGYVLAGPDAFEIE